MDELCNSSMQDMNQTTSSNGKDLLYSRLRVTFIKPIVWAISAIILINNLCNFF